jgi:hypothetical protein
MPLSYYDGAAVSRRILSREDFHPLLFAPSMKEYMDVLFRAVKELTDEGAVSVKMSI